MADFVKMETGTLRSFGLDEKWLQDRISDDPEILGIPKVFLRDRERRQRRAGVLDVLLETADNNKRYEVEIQLGATDESHIIRTIEYWDLEQKRSPQYKHCAVIVAEDITSRFFNVIGLFNGQIPIIAINVTAVKQPDNTIGLVFTHVLNENRLAKDGLPEEEGVASANAKERWIALNGEKAAEIAEHLCDKLGVKSRYLKFYIRTDDEEAELDNKVTLTKVGRKEKPRLQIVVKVSTPSWQELFAREDLGGEADFEDWGYYEDGSVWLEIVSAKQIDDSIDLLCRLYRDAAGIPQPPQITMTEPDASN